MTDTHIDATALEALAEQVDFLISQAAHVKAELISDATTSDYRHGWQSGFMAGLEEVQQTIFRAIAKDT